MKHLLRSGLLALLPLLSFSSPSSALALRPQEKAQDKAQELPSAREIVDRYATVAGLKTGFDKTHSQHIKGTFSLAAMDVHGSMESWSAKPDKHISSIEMGGFGKIVTGFDGKVAWMVQPMVGPRILSGTELMTTKIEAVYDGALKASDLYESMKTVGKKTFEGKECYDVELVVKPLDGMDAAKTREVRTSHEYYEIASGFLIGSEGRQEGEMGGGPYVQVVSDYKDFGGMMVATKTRSRASGQEFVLTVDSVEFDTADANTFALPLEIQKLLEAQAAKPATPAAPKPQ